MRADTVSCCSEYSELYTAILRMVSIINQTKILIIR